MEKSNEKTATAMTRSRPKDDPMSFNDELLNDIFDKTDGKCHICFKKLSFTNYGNPGRRGAWEVEHSNPKAKGGTDHLNNLYASCIPCNRSKGAKSTRSARAIHGRTRAPLSRKQKDEDKFWSSIGYGVLFGFIGSKFSKNGAFFGSVLGAYIGDKMGQHE